MSPIMHQAYDIKYESGLNDEQAIIAWDMYAIIFRTKQP